MKIREILLQMRFKFISCYKNVRIFMSLNCFPECYSDCQNSRTPTIIFQSYDWKIASILKNKRISSPESYNTFCINRIHLKRLVF